MRNFRSLRNEEFQVSSLQLVSRCVYSSYCHLHRKVLLLWQTHAPDVQYSFPEGEQRGN